MKSFYLLSFSLFFILILSSFTSATLTQESSVYYEVVQDDPFLDIDYSVVNGELELDIAVGMDNDFGVYTSDTSYNTGKTKKAHPKHGEVKPIKDKKELNKLQVQKIKYKPNKQTAKIFIGEGTEIVEVVNESKVVYQETLISGALLEYNNSLRRCDASGVNCSIYPHEIDIVGNGPSVYKFGAFDSSIGDNSSWYQYKITSNYPMERIAKYRFGVREDLPTICDSFGCKDYSKYYVIDLSGASSYNIDNNNETHDFASFTLTNNNKILTMNFYSNGSIDPEITEDITSEASSGNILYSGTHSSSVDNAISLNRTTTGWAYLDSSVGFGREVNVTNISTFTYPDFSASTNTLGVWRFEEGSGNAVDEANGYTLTNNGATWVTDSLPGAYSLDFDGVNDYAMYNDGTTMESNSVTIGVWVKVDTAPGGFAHLIGIRRPAGVNGYLLGIPGADTTRFRAFITNDCSGWTQMASDDPYSVGQWHFLAVTATDGAQRFYVDGVLQAATGSTAGNVCYTNQGNFSVGGAQDGSQPMNATIGNLFVLNTALTQTQLSNIMNATKDSYVESLTTLTPEVYISSDNSSFSPCTLGSCDGNFSKVNFSFTSNNQYISRYLYNYTLTYENSSEAAGGGPDITDPVISNVLPNGSNHNNNTIVMINATVTDDVLVETVNVTITLSNGSTHFSNMTVLSGSIYHYNYSIPNIPHGRYNYTILASDNASNEASATAWFNVTNSSAPSTPDNTTITISLTSPTNGSTVTTLTPTFSFTYTHGEGVTGNCTLFINDTDSGSSSCTSGSNTNIVSNVTLVNLTTYDWFIRARAGANETNSSVYNFEINITGTGTTSTSGLGGTVEIAMLMAFFIIIWFLCKVSSDLEAKNNSFVSGAKMGLIMFGYSLALLAFNVGRSIAVDNGASDNIVSMFNTGWTVLVALTIAIISGLLLWSVWKIIKMWIDMRG